MIHTAKYPRVHQAGSADDKWHHRATQEAARMWLNDKILVSPHRWMDGISNSPSFLFDRGKVNFLLHVK